MTKRRPHIATSPTPVEARHLRPGDIVRHDGLELTLNILTDTCWICRLATEPSSAPTHYVPLAAEVTLVRAFSTGGTDPGGETDPLLGGAK